MPKPTFQGFGTKIGGNFLGHNCLRNLRSFQPRSGSTSFTLVSTGSYSGKPSGQKLLWIPTKKIHPRCHLTVFHFTGKKGIAKMDSRGDIKSCFDEIAHTWLENNAKMDKHILKQWLKAGFIEKDVFHHTLKGTPQGSLCKVSHYAK